MIDNQDTKSLIDPSDCDFSASTVLVVDDLQGNRALLKHVLEASGLKNILAAENATEAFKVLGMSAHNPSAAEVDLILMDVVMPGLNGFQATRELSKDDSTSSIPVVLVTTKDQETDKTWGMRQGAKDYVVKPVSGDELVSKVKAAMASAHRFSSAHMVLEYSRRLYAPAAENASRLVVVDALVQGAARAAGN